MAGSLRGLGQLLSGSEASERSRAAIRTITRKEPVRPAPVKRPVDSSFAQQPRQRFATPQNPPVSLHTIQTAQLPQAHAAQSQKQRKAKKHITFPKGIFTKRTLSIAAVVVIITGSSIAYTTHFKSEPSPFDASLIAQLSYVPYYPAHFKAGFTYDAKAFSQPEKNVIILNLIDAKGRKIFISQQPKPDAFDFDQSFGRFDRKNEAALSIGPATIGYAGDFPVVISIMGQRTWLIVNTSRDIPFEDVYEVLQALKPAGV